MSQSQLVKFAQQVATYIIGMPENDAVNGAENEGFCVRLCRPGERVTQEFPPRINVWVKNGRIEKAVAA